MNPKKGWQFESSNEKAPLINRKKERENHQTAPLSVNDKLSGNRAYVNAKPLVKKKKLTHVIGEKKFSRNNIVFCFCGRLSPLSQKMLLLAPLSPLIRSLQSPGTNPNANHIAY